MLDGAYSDIFPRPPAAETKAPGLGKLRLVVGSLEGRCRRANSCKIQYLSIERIRGKGAARRMMTGFRLWCLVPDIAHHADHHPVGFKQRPGGRSCADTRCTAFLHVNLNPNFLS